jgi:hypothetical protein
MIRWLLMISLCAVLASAVQAQETNTAKPASVADGGTAPAADGSPVLDELAREYMTSVALAAQTEQLALDMLKQTEPYKRYESALKARQQLQQDRTARIEKRYPGYTLDWSKRVLVPKGAPK